MLIMVWYYADNGLVHILCNPKYYLYGVCSIFSIFVEVKWIAPLFVYK